MRPWRDHVASNKLLMEIGSCPSIGANPHLLLQFAHARNYGWRSDRMRARKDNVDSLTHIAEECMRIWGIKAFCRDHDPNHPHPTSCIQATSAAWLR